MAGIVVFDAGAVDDVIAQAKPALAQAAAAIGPAIVAAVPVVHGLAIRTYRPSVEETEQGFRVHPGSPFWHWLEYGTATSPAYRPVQNGVQSLGLRFEAS